MAAVSKWLVTVFFTIYLPQRDEKMKSWVELTWVLGYTCPRFRLISTHRDWPWLTNGQRLSNLWLFSSSIMLNVESNSSLITGIVGLWTVTSTGSSSTVLKHRQKDRPTKWQSNRQRKRQSDRQRLLVCRRSVIPMAPIAQLKYAVTDKRTDTIKFTTTHRFS